MTRHLAADEIDKRRGQGESLNAIEIEAMLQVTNQAKKQLALRFPQSALDILCVDSCDIRPERFGAHFERSLGPSVAVFSEHKADAAFVRRLPHQPPALESILISIALWLQFQTSVSAASIIAKVQRDWAMLELEEAHGVTLGSGYPSDPFTVQFLQQIYDDEGNAIDTVPPFVRQTWARSAMASQQA